MASLPNLVKLFAVLMTTSAVTHGFNLDLRVETRSEIRSPLLDFLLRKNLSAEEARGSFSLPHDWASSYFGQDFVIKKFARRQPVFFVGAPHTVDPNDRASQLNSSNSLPTSAKGEIARCQWRDTRRDEPITCSDVTPLTDRGTSPSLVSKPGDAFGLNVNSAPGRVGTVACTPTRVQQCTGGKYSPGFCYRTDTNGRKWAPDPQSRKSNCPAYSLDLMFLLDGSSSVGFKNFDLVKNWTVDIASKFEMDNGNARIGVVQFSHYYEDEPMNEQPYIQTEIKLGKYRSIMAFEDAMKRVKLFKYMTYTAHALNKTISDFKSSNRYRHKGTVKVLVVLTDGDATDYEKLPASADYVRSLGITTFAIGVGNVKMVQLQTIANGKGTNERVFYAKNFAGLLPIISDLRSKILTVALEGGGRADKSNRQLELGEHGFSSVYQRGGVT